ncbi:MAG: MBL fold metallo-hydrolase [Oscillospiraceae bacterium]|nr:MBL fold metallo-hydrolase [Oscillospiraceae bacterium]
MLIKTLPVGLLGTNCYVVTDEETLKCAIIDPGAESNTILDYIEASKLTPVAVILTHGHFDHYMALEAILEAKILPVYINEKEIDRSGQDKRHKIGYIKNIKACKEGDVIEIGALRLQVLETPGHSPGSITIMCEDALFTGDTLFQGDCGRTDLEGGSREEILKSLYRLAMLDGDFEVYPGHDRATTLRAERSDNMDMRIATGELK